jgi:glyoxylase-like metal-dependent hydrolase (beta-lactamase superfamily II)
MERLWGEVQPVPSERIRVLGEAEQIDDFEVGFTPGHASHHVAYRHRPTGWAFTGDVAGVRIAGGPTMAPTPPPDIDLPAWRSSIELLDRWRPECLAITHFGGHADVANQLQELRGYLDEAETLARELGPADFAEAMRARVGAAATAEVAATYEQAMPPDQCYAGLARYLARRERGPLAG